MHRTRACLSPPSDHWLSLVSRMPSISLHITLGRHLWNSLRSASVVQQLLHMPRVVVDQLAWFRAVCKSSHTYLNLQVVSTVTPKTSDVTTTSLNARLQIPTVYLIFMDSHPNSSPKRQYISVALLNNLESATLARDPTNLSNTEPMCPLIVTPDPQLNQSRAWFPDSL